MGSILQLRREALATIVLAFPLIIGQLSQMLIGVADTLMIGQVGVVPLAAATFANTLIHVPFMFGIGMAIAVSVRVSQARGADEPVAARAALRHGLYLTLGMGVLTVIAAWLTVPLLPFFGQKPEVVAAAPGYFLVLAVSMIPAMATMALKNYADAMNRPWPAFWVILGGVALNIVLNWIFIYGHLGAPRMELEGAGLATLVARMATFVGLIVLCCKLPAFRDWVPYHWFRKPDWVAMRTLFAIGWPASLQILAEVSTFVAAALLIGSISIEALASHQVAITCAATVFMIPLGLSQAMTVRMGEALGARTFARWRPIVTTGWLLGLGFALLGAATFILSRDSLAHAFLPDDPATAKVVATLLMIAAAFQIGDALQVISAGALRGLDDVKGPAWISFGIYWGLAIPLGWVAAFPMGMGVFGIWWGITLGLWTTAVVLGMRLWRKSSVTVRLTERETQA